MTKLQDSHRRLVKGGITIRTDLKFGTFGRNVETRLSRNLDMAAMFLEGDIKKSFPQGPSHAGEGEIPHVQTSRLRSSITWSRVEQLIRFVGTNVKYGRFLELGTRKLEGARPFLRPALDRNRRVLLEIIGRRVTR